MDAKRPNTGDDEGAPNKRVRQEHDKSGSTTEQVLCAICLGEEEVGKHSCPCCKEGAWHICETCDDMTLSRQCPICKSDYAPRVLHEAPAILLSNFFVNNGGGEEPAYESPTFFAQALQNKTVAAKLALIARLIVASNVAVYFENRMHFYLPEHFYTGLPDDQHHSNDQQNPNALCAVIDVPPEAIGADKRYLFTNKTWDALEAAIEAAAGEEEEEDEEDDDEGEVGEVGEEVVVDGVAGGEQAPTTAPATAPEQVPATNTATATAPEQAAEQAAEQAPAAGAEDGAGAAPDTQMINLCDIPSGTLLPSKQALKSVFIYLLRGARLFTQMEADQWEVLCSFAEAGDT